MVSEESHDGIVTTPPLWLLGELLVFVFVSVFVLQMPRRCGQLVIGNTWVCYYKSTAHGFHGRFGEREIAWKPCSLLLVLRNDHRSVPAEIQHSIYCPSMHTYTTTLLIH